MGYLYVSVAMLAAPGQRDDMIDVKIVSINRLFTDTTNSLVAFVNDLSINDLLTVRFFCLCFRCLYRLVDWSGLDRG